MKGVTRIALVVVTISIVCMIFGVSAEAASSVKPSDYKLVTASNDLIRYGAESSKYVVFYKYSYDADFNQSITILYTEDMKTFHSVDFKEKAGLNTKDNNRIKKVVYLNKKFYFFTDGEDGMIQYYETSDFKTFKRRKIKKSAADTRDYDYEIYKIGNYYFVVCNEWYKFSYGQESAPIYRSKNMRTWSVVELPKALRKQYSKGYECEITKFGDSMKVGTDSNAILVTFRIEKKSYIKQICYKTTNFKTFTKIESNTINRKKHSYNSSYIKMKIQNKGVHIIEDDKQKTLTLYSGSGLSKYYKKIATIKNVESYEYFINPNAKKSSEEYIGVSVKDKSGKLHLYLSNAKLTSMKRYKTKWGLDFAPKSVGAVGRKYIGLGDYDWLYILKKEDMHIKYTKIQLTTYFGCDCVEVEHMGTFKGRVYIVTYAETYDPITDSDDVFFGSLYTIKQSTFEKAIK